MPLCPEFVVNSWPNFLFKRVPLSLVKLEGSGNIKMQQGVRSGGALYGVTRHHNGIEPCEQDASSVV